MHGGIDLIIELFVPVLTNSYLIGTASGYRLPWRERTVPKCGITFFQGATLDWLPTLVGR